MKEILLFKERLTTQMKVSDLMIPNSIELIIDKMGDDFARQISTIAITGAIAYARKEIQNITVYRKSQKFWDWVRRRDQEFTFEIECKEIMINPPIFPPNESINCYSVKEKYDKS